MRDSRRPDDPKPGTQLTSQERKVMELLLLGNDSKEIAVAMGIDGRTVSTHKVRAMIRLGARNEVQLGVILERKRATEKGHTAADSFLTALKSRGFTPVPPAA